MLTWDFAYLNTEETMERTITVQGKGTLSVPPDLIQVELNLETKDPAYAEMIRKTDERLSRLREALEGLGYPETELKTLHYSVYPEYASRADDDGEYREYFTGFCCRHGLQLSFPLSMEELDRVLSAVFSAGADPGLQIRFTVSDPDALRSELLAAASRDARSRAEALCAASGVKLGDLLQIRSGDAEPGLYSPTMYDVAEAAVFGKSNARSFVPDDIKTSETALFVWAIE